MNRNFPRQCKILKGVLLMGLLLGGCVTTETGLFTGDASPKAALKARVQLARSYIGEGNWEDAKRNLRIAAGIDPDFPDVHEAFALVYQNAGELELAEQSFRRAISLRRKFSRARNNYAAFLYALGRYPEAQEQLERVVRDTLYESRPQAYVNLGLCRVQLGDVNGARRALTRALAMDGDNLPALLELAHIEFDADNWEASEDYLSIYRSLVRRPSSRALWLDLRLAHEQGDNAARAGAALALKNLYPQSAEYHAYERALQHGEL